MNKRSRWIVIAAMGGAAAGGAAWGVRHGRATAARPEAAPAGSSGSSTPRGSSVAAIPAVSSSSARPAAETGPRPSTAPAGPTGTPTRRRPLVVVAGVVAAAIGITTVAVHIHGHPDPPSADLTTVPLPNLPWVPPLIDPYPYGLAPTPPAWTPPTTPPSAGSPTAVPVGGVLPPDGSVIMTGDNGEEMKLALVRIANPAPTIDPQNPSAPELRSRLGYRLISIVVRVENVGGVPFLTDIEKHTWLVDKAGNTYTRNVEMTEARQLHPASELPPASSNGREIVFEVKGGADLTRFRLSTHPGRAKQTQDWKLG